MDLCCKANEGDEKLMRSKSSLMDLDGRQHSHSTPLSVEDPAACPDKGASTVRLWQPTADIFVAGHLGEDVKRAVPATLSTAFRLKDPATGCGCNRARDTC